MEKFHGKLAQTSKIGKITTEYFDTIPEETLEKIIIERLKRFADDDNVTEFTLVINKRV
jgi:hypothetical protein